MDFFRSLVHRLQSRYASLDHTNFKRNVLNALPFWIGAFTTGLVAVCYASLFSWAEQATAYLYHQSPYLFFVLTPALFLLAWWLVQRYAPFAKGSGIPQVSAAIELANPRDKHLVNRLLSIRVACVKVLSSLVMVLGGGLIGREGPTIQISASIFKKINDLLPEWYPKISRQNMIITGAAAGLASAFNTPLGGIVFAIEELTKTHFSYFKSALLTGVIIAGLTALNLLGPYLYLGYPQLGTVPVWIVFFVLIAAVLTGLAGSYTGQLILYILARKAAIRKRYKQVLYVLACGLFIAALGLIDHRMFGSGKEIMTDALFSGHNSLEWYVPLLRILGSVVSFSTGAAGGIFAPSLSAGAGIGEVIAGMAGLPHTAANLVVLCGMAGFLTGITRSPFTSSILVIEMTNSHTVIFYLMLTALTANLVAKLVSKHSFYDVLKVRYLQEVQTAAP
ncbi:MAG: chloride channel protein [Chitinophagaceae bacterium]|nr:chloride channel protein [Chitinophagaceae bacterium]